MTSADRLLVTILAAMYAVAIGTLIGCGIAFAIVPNAALSMQIDR